MANEITATTLLSVKKTFAAKQLSATNKQYTMAGTKFIEEATSIPTTAGGTAINVTGLSSLGFFAIQNNDPTNFITLLNAVSGTPIIDIPAGMCLVGKFNSAVTAPALLANTGACSVDYLVFEP